MQIPVTKRLGVAALTGLATAVGCDGGEEPLPHYGLLLGQGLPATEGLRTFPEDAAEVFWIARLKKAMAFEEIARAARTATNLTATGDGDSGPDMTGLRMWASGHDHLDLAESECASLAPAGSSTESDVSPCWSVVVGLADGSWFREEFRVVEDQVVGQVVSQTTGPAVPLIRYRLTTECQEFHFWDHHEGPQQVYRSRGSTESIQGTFSRLRLAEGGPFSTAKVNARWTETSVRGAGWLFLEDAGSTLGQCWIDGPKATWTSSTSSSAVELSEVPAACRSYMEGNDVPCD